MSLDDWILALHLIAAAAMIGAVTLFWIVVVALRSTDTPEPTVALNRVAVAGAVAIGIGTAGTLLFGIWLAISLDEYEVWDGWVIAAIVLWVIGSATGQRSGVVYSKPAERARELLAAGQTGPSQELATLSRTSTGLVLHAVTTLAVILILIDMIWKPGA
jgi:Predicted integral membrane protein (DUF2269)